MALKGMGGMGGLGGPNLAKMMEQMQKKLVEDAQKMQETLDTSRFEASAGGAVKATVNGHGELIAIVISPDALEPSAAEDVQDMIISAVNEAQGKASEVREAEQKKLMPANIPGLPGLF
jgi:hypothetical protein